MRCLNSVSNFDRLHPLQRHYRRGQLRIQSLVPLHVAAKTGRNIAGHDLENSPHRIARAENVIDFFLHALLGLGIGARQEHLVLARQGLDLLPWDFALRNRNRTNRNHVTQNFNAQVAQQQFCERADRNPRRRFPGRGALQNIARLRKIVLQSSRQIGMAGARRRHPLVFLRIARLHRQRFFPILPVAILEHHRDRRTDRLAVMHARKEVRPVGFDLHAPAASKALLAAPEFAVHKCLVNHESGRQPGKERHQGLAVGFSGSKVAQHVEEAL